MIHEEFVKSVRKAIIDKDMAVMKFEKDKIASIMSDILGLGREAVYRRLRGDVKFSLEEVAQIALELGISIDSLMGLNQTEKSVIELNLIDPEAGFEDVYHAKINDYAQLFGKITQRYSDAAIISAFNKLPYIFYLHFEGIAKFKLFKWAYQMRLLKTLSFKEMFVSDDLVKAQINFVSEIRKIKNTNMVLSSNIFASFINDVNYFHNLSLLDDDDADMLRDELGRLLHEMEDYAATGVFSEGANVQLYISNLDIDSSYMLFKYNNHCYSHVNIYDLGGIESQNEKLCNSHEVWINSLKRYSMLITQSNEMDRYQFFQKQRKIIGCS